MHASIRQGRVKLLFAVPLIASAAAFATAQESRDWNVRKAHDDGRSLTSNSSETLAPQYASPYRTAADRALSERSVSIPAERNFAPNQAPNDPTHNSFHSPSPMPRSFLADNTAHGKTVPENTVPATPAPRRPILPVTFSKREDRASTVVRGNNTTGHTPLPLAPPKEKAANKSSVNSPPAPKGSITTIISSLAVVLGVFFLVVWCARRANPHATAVLPKEVVETLGRTSIGNRQYLQLVRVGSKLLLLSITPHGTETLTEITSNDEVERLTGLCQQHQPGSVTTTFRNILAQLGNEPTAPGFLGDSQADELAIASSSPRRRSRMRLAEDGNA